MVGISVIFRKEVSDAMSNNTFLLTVGVFIISMFFASAAAGYTYYNEKITVLESNFVLGQVLSQDVRIFGILVAISLGFNSIIKERVEGSLKVLLSYPIYRDQVILGKLASGITILSVVTTTSTAIAYALFEYIITKTPTFSELLWLTNFIITAILVLIGYLGLCILLSMILKDPKTTLLTTFLFLGLFSTFFIRWFTWFFSRLVYGFELVVVETSVGRIVIPANPNVDRLMVALQNFDPTNAFVFSGAGIHLDTFSAIRVVVPILLFSLIYIFFTKRDIS